MTVNQIAEYTALLDRRVFILLHSGISWKPEYEGELQELNRKLQELRREMGIRQNNMQRQRK